MDTKFERLPKFGRTVGVRALYIVRDNCWYDTVVEAYLEVAFAKSGLSEVARLAKNDLNFLRGTIYDQRLFEAG